MSLPNKDNITTATSTNQIDWYFSLDNPAAKKRHFLFYGFGITNMVFILIYIFLFAAGSTLFVWIGIVLGFSLLTVYLVYRKNSYYRFVIYLVIFGGLYCSLIFYSMYLAFLIVVIASVIFLINFVTIELSLQRHLNWFVRRNRLRNATRFGHNKLDDS